MQKYYQAEMDRLTAVKTGKTLFISSLNGPDDFLATLQGLLRP
jgi:hypothetical protein